MSNVAKIRLIAGTVAPRYAEEVEVELEEIVITKQGTEKREES